MKKLICIFLALAMIFSFAMPAMAVSAHVCFTSDSVFKVGGTVKVDKGMTLDSIYNYAPSEAANAYLEGYVRYGWYRNGDYCGGGTSLTLKEEDKGCEILCRAFLYSDGDFTEQVAIIVSKGFTVEGSAEPVFPEITTKSLQNGVVGEYYSQQMKCTDPDVEYTLYQSSLPEGLTLTRYGLIEGTPKKAGFYYVVIMAIPKSGEEYAAMEPFELTIEEPYYELEILEVPKKTTYISGEKLDMKGLWVRIYTSDGFIDSRNGEKLSYSKKALVTVGEQKIKLTYENAVAFFIVTVLPAPEETPEPTPEATPEITAIPEKSEGTDGKGGKGDKTNKTEDNAPVKKPSGGKGNADDEAADTTGKDQKEEHISLNEEPENNMFSWIIIGVLIYFAVGLVTVLVVVKRKKNKNS